MLPLDEGIWTGEIIFQSSKFLNINQKTTCQLEVIQFTNHIEASGTVKGLDKLEEYDFSTNSVDSVFKKVKGFTLYDRENILSWSMRLNKIGSLVRYEPNATKPKPPNQSKLVSMSITQDT